MEKQNIRINYSGSGVKTLNGLATFFFIMASVEALVFVIVFMRYIVNYMDYDLPLELKTIIQAISVADSYFRIAIVFFASYTIFKLLSNTAKTALYKRTILEEQYCFVDIILIAEENFSIGEIVMNKYTGERLKITKITEDGRYSCEREDGTYVGDFSPIALKKL